MLSCISLEEQSSQKRDNKHLFERASTKPLIAVKFERKQQESQGQVRADLRVPGKYFVIEQNNYLTVQLVIAVN